MDCLVERLDALTKPEVTIYRAETSGYNKTFTSLSEMKTWLNSLNRNGSLKGKEIVIFQGVRRGNADYFANAKPARVMHYE